MINKCKGKNINLLSLLAATFLTTAKLSMGTACLFLYNQPKVPKSLLKNKDD